MKTQKKLWSALAALCVATVTVAQPAYNYSKLQKEQLGRGVVAIRENPSEVVVSWRYLSSEDVYKRQVSIFAPFAGSAKLPSC